MSRWGIKDQGHNNKRICINFEIAKTYQQLLIWESGIQKFHWYFFCCCCFKKKKDFFYLLALLFEKLKFVSKFLSQVACFTLSHVFLLLLQWTACYATSTRWAALALQLTSGPVNTFLSSSHKEHEIHSDALMPSSWKQTFRGATLEIQ